MRFALNYKLNLGGWNSVFAVPCGVVDNYIKLASGDNIKVLLYFLRNAGIIFTSADIAAAVGLSEDQIEDALLFWCQRGVIEIGNSGFEPGKTPEIATSNTQLAPQSVPTATSAPSEDKIITAKKVELLREPEFTPKEIANTVKDNDAVSFLFQTCESLLGRTLRHNEQNSLVAIIDDTGIPVEVAIMMIDYCNSIDKLAPAYLKTLAASWMEEGITTIELAENKIRALNAYRSIEGDMKRLFEMNTAFSKKQKDYIDTWTNKYNFKLDIIEEAYQRTLDNIAKPSFQYMDKILRTWHEKGITTLEEARNDKKPEAQKTSNSSFDVDDLEQLALKKYNK